MKEETHPAGTGTVSRALANNVGLWMPSLISLAVRPSSTGPRLALRMGCELKSVFFIFKEAFFNFTKRTSISRI